MSEAFATSPDVIGVISWNEFSESSYIEPSVRYGDHYLGVLADILGAPPPAITNFDSDSPPPIDYNYGAPLFGGLLVVLAAGFVALVLRRPRRRSAKPPS